MFGRYDDEIDYLHTLVKDLGDRQKFFLESQRAFYENSTALSDRMRGLEKAIEKDNPLSILMDLIMEAYLELRRSE